MERQIVWKRSPIATWAEFHRSVKNRDQEMLEDLDEYENSVLVSGCHRSGTTALTDLLNRTDGFADYTFGHDSELDGALLLAGCVERCTSGRHCFQTTYLNDRFPEYFLHESFRLIWVLREPRSVVYSMLHNWKHGALNRLYEACASYVATIEQAFALHSRLGDRMLVIDYEELVTQPETTLSRVCAFAGVPFQPSMPSHFHGRSVRRSGRLAPWQATRVDEVCSNFYHAAWSLGPACRLHDA